MFFVIKSVGTDGTVRPDAHIFTDFRVFADVGIGLNMAVSADADMVGDDIARLLAVGNDHTRLEHHGGMNVGVSADGFGDRFERAVFTHQGIVCFKGLRHD